MFPALRVEVRRNANICTRLATPKPPLLAIGKFLMNTLSLAPKVSPADVERMFNTHIQDVLLVEYLAHTIGTRIDLSNRLASANFGATTPTPAAAATNTTATSATPAADGK